jgi:hypothetical protein
MAGVDEETAEKSNSTLKYNNLKKFFDKNNKKFLERIGKGPPWDYRWLAWKVISGVNYSQIPGLYKELLEEADKHDDNEHDKLRQINLDLNRTFPDHPFFSDQQYGNIGQERLKRALRAYAMYNKDVGYTQSINFLMGFFLMVNGGNDEEAFWLFVAITKKNQNFGMVGNFEGGLEGFYADKFPLYHQFVYQFDKLFEKKLPKLKSHFDHIGYPAPVWLQKWFMTLFLYSFPLKLWIRLWDNLLVEGLVYIFKFPLAIMEILETTLLKWNFEEVNDVLSNLRTIDDPDIDPSQAVLPNTEKIINKARKVKLSAEELRKLKKEYDELVAESAIYTYRQIKMLPQILEEEDIYEEVNKMHQNKAHSFNDDELEHSFDLTEEEEKKEWQDKRPNSADLYHNGPSVNAWGNENFLPFCLNKEWNDRVSSKTIYVQVKSRTSWKGVKYTSEESIRSSSNLKLPPIFNNKQQDNINVDILKNLNIETSFDLGTKPKEIYPTSNLSYNRTNKSVKNISTSRKKVNSFSNNYTKGRKQSTDVTKNLHLNLPPFASFAQSLGRFSSVQHFQHARTDRDVMEEINEEINESLDQFLLNNQLKPDSRSIWNSKIKRFETENPKLNNTFSRSKHNESNQNEIEAVSYSANDQLHESYQQAHSDLFLDSQKDEKLLFQPRNIDLDLLDWSESSSLIEDSPAGYHSGNKTHDTMKEVPMRVETFHGDKI